MKHEKALYQYLLENYQKLKQSNTIEGFYLPVDSKFQVYFEKSICFVVCEQENGTGTNKDYFFDDRSDQGFDPITAREALRLLKGGEL